MKSHVSLEQHYCCVCGRAFDTGTILLDKRLRQSLEHHTITGFSLCDEHRALHEQGYVALVGVDESKSEVHGSVMHQKNAHRTGIIMHIRREAARDMFDEETAKLCDNPMFFCQHELIVQIAKANNIPI